MDLPCPVSAEDHRLFAHAGDKVIPGVWDLTLVPNKEPDPGEEPLQFLLVDFLVDENFAADLPRRHVDETGPVALFACDRHSPSAGIHSAASARARRRQLVSSPQLSASINSAQRW